MKTLTQTFPRYRAVPDCPLSPGDRQHWSHDPVHGSPSLCISVVRWSNKDGGKISPINHIKIIKQDCWKFKDFKTSLPITKIFFEDETRKFSIFIKKLQNYSLVLVTWSKFYKSMGWKKLLRNTWMTELDHTLGSIGSVSWQYRTIRPMSSITIWGIFSVYPMVHGGRRVLI